MARAQEYSNRLMAVFNPGRLGHQHEFPSGQEIQQSTFRSPTNTNHEDSTRNPEDEMLATGYCDSTLSTEPSPNSKRRKGPDKRRTASVTSNQHNNRDDRIGPGRGSTARLSPRDDRHPLAQLDTNSPVRRRNPELLGNCISPEKRNDYADGRSILEDVSKFVYTDIDLDLSTGSL